MALVASVPLSPSSTFDSHLDKPSVWPVHRGNQPRNHGGCRWFTYGWHHWIGLVGGMGINIYIIYIIYYIYIYIVYIIYTDTYIIYIIYICSIDGLEWIGIGSLTGSWVWPGTPEGDGSRSQQLAATRLDLSAMYFRIERKDILCNVLYCIVMQCNVMLCKVM